MRFAKTLDRDREISFEVPNGSHSQETKFQNSALRVLPCQRLILDFCFVSRFISNKSCFCYL
jgi:hypothetical protein